MKRSKKLVLVALVLSGVILLGVAPQAWRSLAYEQPDLGEFKVHTKRYGWIPGPETITPDQPCLFCLGGGHQWCTSRRNAHDASIEIEGRGFELRFRCTCSCPQ